MNNIVIKGIGHCLPQKEITNEIILQRLNSTEEFIISRTGVMSRRYININESLSDIAIPAIQKALESAKIQPEDIDLFIVNTLSPDYNDPSEACFLQKKVGFRNIPSFDIRAQCSGMLYGINIAMDSIKAGSSKNVMILCGEVLSKRADYSDQGRNLSILIGDGAGAIIVGLDNSDEKKGFMKIRTGADGDYFNLLWTESPGTKNPTFNEGNTKFRMNGKDMFEHASKTLTSVAQDILHENNLTLDDIDLIIPHQPNLKILEAVISNLGICKDKIYINVDKYGNMASASLPIALSMAHECGLIKEGGKYLFLTYGSGATWGAAIYQN